INLVIYVVMIIRSISKVIYFLFGLFFLIVGIAIVLFNTGLLPIGIKNVILNITQNNLLTLHILREFGAMMIMTSLISFWFIKDYKNSFTFHVIVSLYWGIMSIIHWSDYSIGHGSVIGQIINTIPFLFFSASAILRRIIENK
ncbi:MAG: hypothetical protein ABUL44_03535, partial [Flavobacterium sp.]